MKKIHHIVTTVTIVLLSISSLSAQRTSPEFSVYSGWGYSFFAYSPSVAGTSSNGFSGDVGLGITAFFNRQLGIHAGVAFGLYNVKGNVATLNHVTPGLYDIKKGLNYDLHTTLTDYNEVQNTMFMSFPVMFQFQTKMNQTSNWRKKTQTGFYAMTGIKTLILLNGNYASRIELRNEAFYPDFETLMNPVRTNVTGALKLGALVMFSLEAGIKWRFNQRVYLYTGAFFDCGLNDPVKDYRVPYEYYTSAASLQDFTILKFTDRVNLMTVGFKLRWAFSLGSSRNCY
jgi:hypothetical protein